MTSAPIRDTCGTRKPDSLAVRWYLRYGLSYRDVEELLTKDRDRRACLRAERSARLLRAGGRGAGEPAVGGRVRRAGLGDLIPGRAKLQHAATWRNATAPQRWWTSWSPPRRVRIYWWCSYRLSSCRSTADRMGNLPDGQPRDRRGRW